MNILLIQPPITVKRNEAFAVTPPLSLGYLAAVAEQKGHRVRILDTIVEGLSFRTDVGRLVRVGLPEDAIKREVGAFQPDLVGITCPFTLMDVEMRRVASLVKEVNPDVLVAVGGAHPSSLPEYVIQDANIDFLIVGEGEKTFAELIKSVEAGEGFLNVNGLVFKRNGEVVRNPPREFIDDLDSVPYPAWHLMSIEKYIASGQAHGSQRRKRYFPMVTSRVVLADAFSVRFTRFGGIGGGLEVLRTSLAKSKRLFPSMGFAKFILKMTT